MPALPENPRAERMAFIVVTVVAVVFCIVMAGFAPVWFVHHASQLQEMLSGYWGHVIGYALVATWIGGMGLHFWLKRYRRGVELSEVAILLVATLVASVATAQFVDGPLNKFLVARQLRIATAYYYQAQDQDIAQYGREMNFTVFSRLMDDAILQSKDFTAVKSTLKRSHALVAKFRGWEKARRGQSEQTMMRPFYVPPARDRAKAAMAKTFDDISPLMDRFWVTQEELLKEEDAAVAVLEAHKDAWRGSWRAIVFSDQAVLAEFHKHSGRARLLSDEIRQIGCMMQNVRSGGCTSDSEMVGG